MSLHDDISGTSGNSETYMTPPSALQHVVASLTTWEYPKKTRRTDLL